MECKGQVYFPVIIIIHHRCCVSNFCKTFPVQCPSLLHEDLSTAGCHLSSGRELLCCGVWSNLKDWKCSRNSWVSAMDLLVSFIQLALIQSLPAMLLGWTRLCNRRGKHSMSVVQAPRVATGLFLMILIKPGPFLSISQRGKKLDRLYVFIVWVYFAPRLGRMWEYWVFFPVAAASVKAALQVSRMSNMSFADPEALTCLMSSLEWNGYRDSSRGNKQFIA